MPQPLLIILPVLLIVAYIVLISNDNYVNPKSKITMTDDQKSYKSWTDMTGVLAGISIFALDMELFPATEQRHIGFIITKLIVVLFFLMLAYMYTTDSGSTGKFVSSLQPFIPFLAVMAIGPTKLLVNKLNTQISSGYHRMYDHNSDSSD